MKMQRILKQYGMRLAFVALMFVACVLGFIEPSMAMLAGGAFLTVETVAGATLSCTTSVPATYDQPGYTASSMIYTLIGEITDLPGAPRREYAESEHAPIASRQRTRKKASYNLANMVINMGWDDADAGQDLCRTAADDDSVLTFKLVKQSGAARYWTAQVKGLIENMGTIDNVVQGQLTLLPQTNTISDPA